MENDDCTAPGVDTDVSRRLVVVGTGIQWASQTTLAAQRAMQLADRVLFAVADPWAARWIREISPDAVALDYPRNGPSRKRIYEAMVDRILAELSTNSRVCAVFYGCPAVLTQPAHDAIRRARQCGYEAIMLPGVSFLECLFVDLAIDPGREGCQVFEGSDFLLRSRTPDIHAHLILCQVGLIGNRMAFDPSAQPVVRGALALLQRRLMRHYPAEHPLVIYEAARQPTENARIERLRLDQLCSVQVSGISTLYVAPVCPALLDEEMLAELSALQRAWFAPTSADGSEPAAFNQESS